MTVPSAFDDETLEAIRQRLSSLSLRRVTEAGPEAAVLIPLCTVSGQPGVLLTKRSETVGSHKGQVSFPGGRRDDGDVDATDTALRELEEEVGISRHHTQILGSYHQALSINRIKVTAVIGYVGVIDPHLLNTSVAEIDVAFALSLSTMVDPAQRAIQIFGTRQAPVFNGGPFPVWGLTAYFLQEFLHEGLGITLAPPTG
jgi:8-oxo-dGTP pyrophosphatase MutT (NUDIX family)